MNTKLTVNAVSLILCATATTASAINVDITNMNAGSETVAVVGTLYDDGTGHLDGAPFIGVPFSVDTAVYFETDGTGLWAGSSQQGAYSYNFTLAAGEVAFGILFNWNGNNGIPILNIMDCGAGNIGEICTGRGTPVQTSPLPGQEFVFDGVVSAVPVPAAFLLMGSGLLGFVGVARRRKPV